MTEKEKQKALINEALKTDQNLNPNSKEWSFKEFYLKLEDLVALVKLKPEKIIKELKLLNGEIYTKQGKSYVPPALVRSYLQARGYEYQPHVYSYQMLKGGVAKTSSCLNMGLRAAMYGFRVLFLDLDQQANLSFALGVDDLESPVFINVLEKKVKLLDAIIPISDHIGLLPSNLNNSVIERVLLQGTRNLGRVVSGSLTDVFSHYDLVFIDTSPSLSALNTSVTCASQTVVMPINPDKFTLFGAQKHLADLQQIQEDFNLKLDIKILFTKYDAREAASEAFYQQSLNLFGHKMLRRFVRHTSEIKNSIASGRTIFDYKGHAKEDYDRVTRDLLSLW